VRFCIPIPFRPEGGGQYFLQNFRNYVAEQGHSATMDVTEPHDVLFTNHWVVPLHVVFKAIRHNQNVRIVQRIDGSANDYGRYSDADARQHEVNEIADLTIFQSEYCRWSTREKFPVIGQDGPVIHNPVDLCGFNPEGPREELPGRLRLASVAWSTNPRKGAASIYAVANAHPNIDFFLCGRFECPPALPNLHPLGVLGRERLASVLRSCHGLLTFSENEACPNHVLEALATGLPVMYRDSGAMAEIIGDCGIAITVGSFGSEVPRLLNDWPSWRARSRDRAVECFNPKRVFARYLEVIHAATLEPSRVAPRARFAWALSGRLGAWAIGRRQRIPTTWSSSRKSASTITGASTLPTS
jgi:glycosyltransferase involved in cell wall biosynthesis